MPSVRNDLGTAKVLKAEAHGEPGKRTFRIVAEAEQGTASLWMEKEQLSALALSIKGYIEEMEDETEGPRAEPATVSSPEPSFDFKLASLALSYDEATHRFGILAYDERDAETDTATLVCWTPRQQAEAMAEEALEAVSAGHPICQLCHRPMEKEGHMCPHYNGHGSVKDHL